VTVTPPQPGLRRQQLEERDLAGNLYAHFGLFDHETWSHRERAESLRRKEVTYILE
jgi:hypothetical protein